MRVSEEGRGRLMSTSEWLLLGIVAVYFFLQFYLFPKLGVPT